MAVEEIDIHEPSSKSYTGLSPGWTRDHSQQLSFFIIKTRTRPKYSIKAEERGIPSKLEKRHHRCSDTKLSQYQHYRPSNNTSSSDIAHVQRQNWERDSYSIKQINCRLNKLTRGYKLLVGYQDIYILVRNFSRLTQDTQTTTHTVPPNAAPTIQRISPNNTVGTSHPIYRQPVDTYIIRFDCYYNTSDQTVKDPSNQMNISRETNPAPRPAWTKQEGASYPSITSLRISRPGISPA